jgi:hypothetical protein
MIQSFAALFKPFGATGPSPEQLAKEQQRRLAVAAAVTPAANLAVSPGTLGQPLSFSPHAHA